MAITNHNKAIFIDRDGTLIKECDYLSRPSQIKYFKSSFSALRKLMAAGYKLIMITNQAGIAKGYFTLEDMRKVHKKIVDDFHKQNIFLDEILSCPHHPQGIIKKFAIDCDCRKPKLKLFQTAIEKYSINVHQSFFIGDKLTDIQSAQKLGGTSILLRTGHGREEAAKAKKNGWSPDYILNNLNSAVKIILES